MADASNRGDQRVVAWGDLVFALAVILAAAVVWFGTADLPPPRYEPVGSAALPRAIASLMSLLSIFVAVRAVRAGGQARGGEQTGGLLRIAALAGLLVIFVAVMDARIVGFRPAAAAFLFVSCAILGGLSLSRLAGYTVFSAILSLGLHAVFTRLFYIDLP